MWAQNKYFFGTVDETDLARSLVLSVARRLARRLIQSGQLKLFGARAYSSVPGHQKQLLCFLSERRQFCCTAYKGQTVKSAQLSLNATY